MCWLKSPVCVVQAVIQRFIALDCFDSGLPRLRVCCSHPLAARVALFVQISARLGRLSRTRPTLGEEEIGWLIGELIVQLADSSQGLEPQLTAYTCQPHTHISFACCLAFTYCSKRVYAFTRFLLCVYAFGHAFGGKSTFSPWGPSPYFYR